MTWFSSHHVEGGQENRGENLYSKPGWVHLTLRTLKQNPNLGYHRDEATALRFLGWVGYGILFFLSLLHRQCHDMQILRTYRPWTSHISSNASPLQAYENGRFLYFLTREAGYPSTQGSLNLVQPGVVQPSAIT